jgi:hypothetical protein
VASIENSDRAGLTVSDQIHSIEIARNEFGYSNKRIGEELLHMGEAAVRSLWRLRKLPKEILDLLDKGEINQQTARRILTACQIADTEKVVSKILGLPERNESSRIEHAIVSPRLLSRLQVHADLLGGDLLQVERDAHPVGGARPPIAE